MNATADRIARAAADLISVRGYAATSTRDIAAAVGVRQPAIYKHFGSKDDVLASLVRLVATRPLAVAHALTQISAPATVKLHRWLDETVQHLQESPNVYASILVTPELLQQQRFARELELVTQIESVIVDMIDRGQREGDMRPVDPVSAARIVQAQFDVLAFDRFSADPADIVEFAMRGLLVDAAQLTQIRSLADDLAFGPV